MNLSSSTNVDRKVTLLFLSHSLSLSLSLWISNENEWDFRNAKPQGHGSYIASGLGFGAQTYMKLILGDSSSDSNDAA